MTRDEIIELVRDEMDQRAQEVADHLASAVRLAMLRAAQERFLARHPLVPVKSVCRQS